MLTSNPDQGKEDFKEPATAKGVTQRVENKYKHSTKEPIYIRQSVPGDSIIVAANAPASTGPPPERECKTMELAGRKMEREATTQWRITNSNVPLNRYAHEQWDKVEELTHNLSEDLKKKFKGTIQDG